MIIIGLISIAWLLLPFALFYRIVQLERDVNRVWKRLDQIERAVPAPRAEPSRRITDEGSPQTPTSGTASLNVPAPEPEHIHAAPPPSRELDLEERIGGRWLQHVGLLVLLLGIAFFLRYAFDRAWLSPAVRIGLGLLTGVVMAGGGVRLSRRYRTYGLLLSGGGIAVLYLSVYAGLNLYFLLGAAAAFGLFLVITVAAALLADSNDSQSIAIIAVCGGFATPFLVGGNRDEQITLFSYVALLIMATMYLAHRRRWPWLNVVSLALTAATIVSWAAVYYTDGKYLRTELFLTLYCAMFLDILRRSWKTSGRLTAIAALLLVAPVSYHLWSVVALAPHGLAFLIYLITFTVLLVGLAVHDESSLLRSVAWVAMALPLGVWIDAHHWRDWVVASVAAIVGIYAVHAAAALRAVAVGEDPDERDVVVLHANGIGFYVALYQVLTDTLTVAALAGLAVVLAGANAGLWAAVRRRSNTTALHWLGVAFTLIAIAIWVQLGGPWAVATWATEGAVVVWIAFRAQRHWLRIGGWVLLVLAIVRWVQPDIQQTTTSFVLVVNARALTGMYIVAMLYATAWTDFRDRRDDSPARALERAALIIAASVITTVVVSTEILSFWELDQATTEAHIASQMLLTASWVIYAALLIVIGMRWRYAPIRYFAIALFGVALVKVFLVDLATLGGAYRVAGFIVIGVILLLVSFLYQRGGVDARLKRSEDDAANPT